MPRRVLGSMRARQTLSDLIEGRLSSPDGRAELAPLPRASARWPKGIFHEPVGLHESQR